MKSDLLLYNQVFCTIIDCSFEVEKDDFQCASLILNAVSPFGKSDDVTSLNESTDFIPNRDADAARLVGHFTRAHLMAVFGLRHSSLKKRRFRVQIL